MSLNDIDYYIKQTDVMENSSAGGSACYTFNDDNVALVKRVSHDASQPFGQAEKIAKWVNEKNEKGVRIPKYLAIKRTEENGKGVCWVLQEKAGGINKAVSYSSEVLSAPDSHYEHLVSDMCELMGSGFERKSKNIFYDSDKEKGGFTLIDFTTGNPRDFNNTFNDVYLVYKQSSEVVQLSDWRSKRYFTKEENMEASRRIFMAMEKVVPNFEHNRRKLLRRLLCDEKETFDYFSTHGIDVGDLTLTFKEQKQFETDERKALCSVLEGIKSGEVEPDWDNIRSAIGCEIYKYGLYYDWAKHPENLQQKDFHKRSYDTFAKILMSYEDAGNTNLAKAKMVVKDHITKEEQQHIVQNLVVVNKSNNGLQ